MVKQVSRQGLDWFQNARFGMFIHWGLYSILGREAWVMHYERIPAPEYARLMERFNPTAFNAEEWVSIAADAGQKYMVFTSRHHDGFSMYDTALSDYKVTHTPFKRDPLNELADACARRGDIKLGIYSSVLDWHHPAYRFREQNGLAWSDYVAFLHGQVRELCTNFGEIACIWLDGEWPRDPLVDERSYFRPGGSFEYEQLYDMIHTLQPDAVIINNRDDKPLPGEDIQGFEQDLPGVNPEAHKPRTVYTLPLEVCITFNDHWGYTEGDRNHKSTRWLVETLARSASAGANLLLNVGPTPRGEILPEHVARLRAMGRWLEVNGDAIYDTREGMIPPTQQSVSTRKGELHYLHVLNPVSDYIPLKDAPTTLTQAKLLRDGSPVEIADYNAQKMLYLAEDRRDPFDTVVVLSATV